MNQRLRDILAGLFRQTAYMQECARGGAPVPPDFAVTGSAWTHRGNLSTNMLDPGGVVRAPVASS
jgi:hypothetical protein